MQRKIIGDYNAHKKLDAGESEADRREAIASWIKNNKKQFEDNKAKAKVVAIVGSKLDWSPYMHGVASTSVR